VTLIKHWFEIVNNSERQIITNRVGSTKSLELDQWFPRGAAMLLLVAGLTLVASPADARWYKWGDEDGNISYQDHPPPSDFEESSQVLNDHGVTLKRIPSKQEAIEQARLERIEAAKRQRDDALVRAFPNEGDLLETREKRITHIDGAIGRLDDQMIILNTRLASIEDRIHIRQDRNLAPSPALDSDRIAVLRSIDSTNALITSKLNERRQVGAKFDSDLARYRELKGTSTATALNNE